jgi:hypothetical protein
MFCEFSFKENVSSVVVWPVHMRHYIISIVQVFNIFSVITRSQQNEILKSHMALVQRLYQKFVNPKFIPPLHFRNTFSHSNRITVTTAEKIIKIQEDLKLIPLVWSGQPCEVDSLPYDHDHKKVWKYFPSLMLIAGLTEIRRLILSAKFRDQFSEQFGG